MDYIYYCYPEGKHKALTLSYDDGKIADRRLVEIFNTYNLKSTFHINGGVLGTDLPTGKRIRSDEVAGLYKGHEVSCHTVTHPTIARCPLVQVADQILQDRKILESLVQYPVRGISYPNGSYTEEIKNQLKFTGFEYARITGNSENFKLPADLFEWKATCHHNHRLLELGDEFLALFKKQHLYLFYVWGHSYEFDNDNNWDLIETFAKKIANKSEIWYCTNIEFVDYMKAARSLQTTVDGKIIHNPSAIPVWVSINNEKICKINGGQTFFCDKSSAV